MDTNFVKTRSPDRSVQKKPRVFVVDGDVKIGLILKAMITRFDYTCIGPAPTLANALEIANNSEIAIDAAIIDFVLDGLPRYELCHALTDWGIPFAFVSEIAHEAIIPRWRTRPFIPKPFAEPEVATVLSELLRMPTSHLPEKTSPVVHLRHPGEAIVR
jgi:DNA-binding response OmpR family regulator